MADLETPPGVAVPTGLTTLYTNAANSGMRKVVQLTFNNIDGINDANLTAVNWLDASASNAATAILPVNVKVAKLDSVTVVKTTDPGDVLQGSASANGDISCIVEVIAAEPVA